MSMNVGMILFAVFIFWGWYQEMFSDSAFGQMGRSLLRSRHRIGNLFSIGTPLVGVATILAALSPLYADWVTTLPLAVQRILAVPVVVLILAIVVSLLPLPLPDWLQPDKRAEMREAERARLEEVANPQDGGSRYGPTDQREDPGEPCP